MLMIGQLDKSSKVDKSAILIHCFVMKFQAVIQEKGLKQAWLADRLGIRKDSFSRMVRGETRFPIEKVHDLARALAMTVEEVVVVLSETATESESAAE